MERIMMAEAGAEQALLEHHSLPSEPDCFASTVTSYSEGSAAMDMCVKTESDEEDISQPAYCTEVQGFGAEEMDSGLQLDTGHIKTEAVMVKILDDDGNLQLCNNTEELSSSSQQLNSCTELLSTQCKSETGDVKVEQHLQLEGSSSFGTAVNEAASYSIKEEFLDLQVNEFSFISCSLPVHHKSEIGEVGVEQHSQVLKCFGVENDINGAAHYSIKEEYADIQLHELNAFHNSLSKQHKSVSAENTEQHSEVEESSSTEMPVIKALGDILQKNPLGLENSVNTGQDNFQTNSDLENPVVPIAKVSKQSCNNGVTHKAHKLQCFQCKRVCTSKLDIDLQTDSSDHYFCTQYRMSFSHSCCFKQHQVFHCGKHYECSECGKTFFQSAKLQWHQLIHSSEKSYTCNECGKYFSQQRYLKKHQVIHSGEKPYKCSECGKSFSQANHLKQHKPVHSGEKPHTCSECGKNFARESSLKVHQRIHSGEKPYKCTQCGKSFSQGGNLKQHELIHTGEKPYKCTQCGKSFALRQYLKMHEITH